MSGSTLTRAGLRLRVAHALFAVTRLASLGYVWRCALRRRRGRALPHAVAWLGVEGAALVVGRGQCPLAGLQRQVGDPVPLFELVLPPRAARLAVPAMAAISVLGIVIVAAQEIARRDEEPACSRSPI